MELNKRFGDKTSAFAIYLNQSFQKESLAIQVERYQMRNVRELWAQLSFVETAEAKWLEISTFLGNFFANQFGLTNDGLKGSSTITWFSKELVSVGFMSISDGEKPNELIITLSFMLGEEPSIFKNCF